MSPYLYFSIPKREIGFNPRRRWPLFAQALGIAVLSSCLSSEVLGQTLSMQTLSSQSLSLDAALKLAEARSQALPAQEAAAASAREMAVVAGRLPDPTLRLSIDNVPADGPMRFSLTEDFMTMRSVGLSQTLTREGKRHARSARYEREADAALATRTMRLADLRRDTALAWFDRNFQQKMVDLLSQQGDEASLLIEAANAAYRGGRGSQADVFTARSAVAKIGDRIREVQVRVLNATTTLARWVGNAASMPLGDAPQLSTISLTDHGLAHQLDQHPDIALMTAKENLAQAEVDVATQEKSSDWNASLMVGKRGPEFSHMISFAMSVPLQWDQKNRQDRELAAKLAKVEQAHDEREEMLRAHLAKTQTWLATWRSDLARLDDYDATLIPLTAERTRAELAAFRGGKASLSAVVDARRMEIDTRIERLRIEMEVASMWAELEYLIPDSEKTSNSVPPAAQTYTVREPQ